MTTKGDLKHLVASTIQGGLHTVILPLKFDVKQIKWIAKTSTTIHFDLFFDVDTNNEVKTSWGVYEKFFFAVKLKVIMFFVVAYRREWRRLPSVEEQMSSWNHLGI